MRLASRGIMVGINFCYASYFKGRVGTFTSYVLLDSVAVYYEVLNCSRNT